MRNARHNEVESHDERDMRQQRSFPVIVWSHYFASRDTRHVDDRCHAIIPTKQSTRFADVTCKSTKQESLSHGGAVHRFLSYYHSNIKIKTCRISCIGDAGASSIGETRVRHAQHSHHAVRRWSDNCHANIKPNQIMKRRKALLETRGR